MEGTRFVVSDPLAAEREAWEDETATLLALANATRQMRRMTSEYEDVADRIVGCQVFIAKLEDMCSAHGRSVGPMVLQMRGAVPVKDKITAPPATIPDFTERGACKRKRISNEFCDSFECCWCAQQSDAHSVALAAVRVMRKRTKDPVIVFDDTAVKAGAPAGGAVAKKIAA